MGVYPLICVWQRVHLYKSLPIRLRENLSGFFGCAWRALWEAAGMHAVSHTCYSLTFSNSDPMRLIALTLLVYTFGWPLNPSLPSSEVFVGVLGNSFYYNLNNSCSTVTLKATRCLYTIGDRQKAGEAEQTRLRSQPDFLALNRASGLACFWGRRKIVNYPCGTPLPKSTLVWSKTTRRKWNAAGTFPFWIVDNSNIKYSIYVSAMILQKILSWNICAYWLIT